MAIGERAWKAVRWGATTIVTIVASVFGAVWSLLAPWSRIRRAPFLTEQPHSDSCNKAVCCGMDLTTHRKNPWIKPCHCKFNTILYVNLAPKYKNYKDSFEEAERQVHLAVRKPQASTASTVGPDNNLRASRDTPSPTPTPTSASGPGQTSPGSKGGRDPRGQSLTLRQGAQIARHRPPEARHIKATNL
ncbi:uncharacterized protein LOC111254451 isoform X1 [Varroa destructor]|uniref:Uncharacterized protein n=1 Tax=Varroa destructor TaxID=109461 RepID=A0A7M7KUZ1_VARDE|nr:uncharacterized protein LOC111254451 isoform X1 [Varroa destructor]XP_022671053.1 uncharacterized protein LOC111254451 isoform X1 [Varroa destructor]